MIDRRAIARQAITAALHMRRSAGYGLDHAICVYDLAGKLGVEVRFMDLPSMDGMYSAGSDPTIIVSSLRPPGRRAFTCAHELGHHSQGDGVRMDDLVEQWERPRFDPKEFMADCFAGELLMPKMAISKAFAVRGWPMNQCTPAQTLMVAGNFGVGYTTLIHHMRSALQVLSDAQAQALLKIKPRKAQDLLLGWEMPDPVWVVDTHWAGKAIDVEVGDAIFVCGGAEPEGMCIQKISDAENGRLFCVAQPGIGRLENGSAWSAFVRISRPGYVGRSVYRHWEEADD